jgi:cysteine desulfurase/selenocysteine lyase
MMAQEIFNRIALENSLDAVRLRRDFPILLEQGAGRELVYLDNAATSQKPNCVIEAIADCYRSYNAPVHRGLYKLAQEATARYEDARARIARFIHAPSSEQIIFTRSTTESINMVARGWAASRLKPGDAVWVTRMEHHSNFLPWQRICHASGAELRMVELNPAGELDLSACPDLFGPRTRLIALSLVSNVLGAINPVSEIVQRAAERNIAVLADAAQAASHIPIDVETLGCDFLALSAHKMCGPNGIGLLYAKPQRLEEMEPMLLGGGMVDQVEAEEATWAEAPAKFEAGSPNLAGAVGFAAAADYLDGIGMIAVQQHIAALTRSAMDALTAFPDITVYGPIAARRAGIISFNLASVHPHDLVQAAGEEGVALRAGHHCCQPLMHRLGISGTARASFALYNTISDIDALVAAIDKARRLFA